MGRANVIEWNPNTINGIYTAELCGPAVADFRQIHTLKVSHKTRFCLELSVLKLLVTEELYGC